MSLLNQENIIGQEHIKNHNVTKYDFKNITSEMMEASNDIAKNNEDKPTKVPSKEEIVAEVASAIDKELVEKLLLNDDEITSKLAKMEIQFEKQQAEFEQRVASAKEEGYKDGFREAEDKIKAQMQSELNAQKEAMLNAIITLENTLKDSQKHLETLEKELSAISVDIAKEVLLNEVSENSQKIALGLTQELLKSIIDATNVKIKVNPSDYMFLKEALADNTKVEVIADSAVSLGGVVIVSDSGNIDGTIMARYKNLKASVLENMKD